MIIFRIRIIKIFGENFYKNIKNSGLYFGASIVQLIFALFTTPVFSLYLEATDFAIIGYFTAIQSFLNIIFTLAMTNFFLVKFYEKNSNNGQILFNIFLLLTIFNLFFSVLSYFAIKYIFHTLNINFPFFPYTLIIISTLFFTVYGSFLQIYFRIQKEALKFFFFRSFTIIVGVTISIFFVVVLKMGAAGKLIGLLVVQFVATILTFYVLRKFLVYKIDFTIIKQGLKYSIPLIFASIVYYPIINIDRLLLERLNEPSEFGLYSIGLTIANYLFMVGFSLYQAFEPDVFKFIINKQFKKLAKYLILLVTVLLTIHLGFILLSKPIISMLTAGRYTMAYKYANYFSVSFYFLVLFSFTSAILKAFKKTKVIFIVNLIVGSFSLVLVPQLIKTWQFTGAAIGRIILFALLFLLTFVLTVYEIRKKQRITT